MKPMRIVEGRIAPLDMADVDTDQIMPVQFLKHPERTGFARFLFHNWMDDPGFVLADPRHRGARILVAGPNFGCGSSREHAPWGLQEFGFDVIVAPSFGDIFRSNSTKIGLLCARASPEACRGLIAIAQSAPDAVASVDLPAQTIAADGRAFGFEIDAHAKRMLMEGIDHIEATLRHEDLIAAYERTRLPFLPRTRG